MEVGVEAHVDPQAVGDEAPEGAEDSPSPVDHRHPAMKASDDPVRGVIDAHQHRIFLAFSKQRSANPSGAYVGKADRKALLVGQLLKGHGFRWSPTRKAWVRMLNNRGRYAAMRVREKLDA